MAAPRYQVLERIDAGGMAEVFKGKVSTVEGIEKLVAIKRVLPGLSENDKFVGMFLDEARVAMQLSHANVVHVYDIGKTPDSQDPKSGQTSAGAFFIVMEYVDGVNLKAINERNLRFARRLPVELSLYIMTEICKALAYAHALRDLQGQPLGIVHRDVSPPNVLMSRAGEVKLADFGLAKAHSQVEATDPGIVKGKFSYLSPEAAYGEEVDPRSDVFSAGIILWELMAGRRLFYGDTDMETLELVRKCQVPPLAGLHPEVGQQLSDIVLKALTRDLDARWQSARELGDAMIRYLFSRGLAVSSQDVGALLDRYFDGEGSKTIASAPARLPAAEAAKALRAEMAHFTSLPGVGGRPAPVPEAYDGSEPSDLDEGGEVVAGQGRQDSPLDPRTWDLEGMGGPGGILTPPARVPETGRSATPITQPLEMPHLNQQPVGIPYPASTAEVTLRPFSPEAAEAAQASAVPLWIVILLLSVVMFLSISAMYLWMADSLAQ